MVTSVSFGNFYQLNGKTVLAGAGGSGIDTQALIAGLVAVKQQPATNDQTQITANDAQTTALNNFQQLLSTFQSASQALSNPPGVGSNANNVFQFTTGSIGNGGSSYFNVTTSAGAALQTYNISDITSLASAGTQSSGTFNLASADTVAVADTPTAGMFTAGAITFASGSTVTLTDTDTLDTIASKFNAVSSLSGVTATVVQVDSSHYQIAFTATNSGSTNSFDLTNTAETTLSSGASLLSNIGLGTAKAGTDAKFKLNGIAITRSSNNISDVINDVTFNLQATTPADADPSNPTEYPVTVAPDTTTIQNEMVAWVNAYNAIQTFAAQQTQLNSDGTYATTAVLANNQTFRSIMTDLNQQIVSQVSGLASGSNGLSDFGITLTNQPASSTAPAVNNILTVDDGALTSALSTDFSDVENIFGINFTSDSPDLEAFTVPNTATATSFTLSADPVSGTFTASIDGGTPIVLTATPLPSSSSQTLGTTPFQVISTSGGNTVIQVTADTTSLTNGSSYTISGDTETINGIPPSVLNGTYTISNLSGTGANNTFDITVPSASLSNPIASFTTDGTDQTVTVTTTNPLDLTTGDTVTFSDIAGSLPGGLADTDLTSNSPFTVTVTGTNTYTITMPGSGALAAGTGGTADSLTTTAGQGTITLGPPPGSAGYTLTGPAGTALAGLVMIFGGSSAESINVTLTQGVAAQTYNTTTNALTTSTGLIPVALQALSDSDTQLNKDITNINALVTVYQNQLIAQFTALETAVSSVNTLLNSLNANSVAAQEAANIT